MPRIDPLQLLRCLSVLLRPDGGILSRDEVPRLVNLMTKFSKKLVSKCVYVNILKSTELDLVDLFMAEGGWTLVQTWLQDAMHIANWDLVREILTLLLSTPIDVERLKLNNIPKLVKGLTRLEEDKGVQGLSQQLVQNWLQIVKNSTKIDENRIEPQMVQAEKVQPVEAVEVQTSEECTEPANKVQQEPVEREEKKDFKEIAPSSFYKLTIKDGKQVISRTVTEEETATDKVDGERKDKKDERSKDKRSERSKSSSSGSSSKSHKSSSRSRDKDRDRDRDKDKDKHRSSSKSSSSSRDKDRKDRDKERQKDRHRSNGEKSKDVKDKQSDTISKMKAQVVDKLGKIPKKDPKDVKKSTISIEPRKTNEERPKTVKVFNSKRRSTGLEEEAKPAPPRTAVKKPSATTLPTIPPVKRPSPPREPTTPPTEKKLKLDIAPPERPGAIKLIPPKPKPAVLQESDIFMDALTASAAPKKENKKRKRRPSTSKEPESPAEKEAPSPSSPLGGMKSISTGLNFYQDSLQTDENNENEENTPQNNENKEDAVEAEKTKDDVERVGEKIETVEVKAVTKDENGLKGALMYSKRRGPKKSVRFNDSDLTQVRFFELDETERVNVTRTFMDMAKMEMSSEREALQMSRKLTNEDLMEPQMFWRVPVFMDQPETLVAPGARSLEKDIQFAREKSVLQALYFDKRKIPDNPEDPDPETHQMKDPIIIPLEDPECQELDLRTTPWPEPKGSPPHQVPEPNIPPQIFNNIPIPFQNFPNIPPNLPFPNVPPRFVGPNQFPPNMIPNGMGPPNLGPPHPDMLPQGPPMFGPGGPGPDFNPMMNDNFGPMHQFNPPPPNMGGPMFNNNFNNRGRGGPPFRRGGNNGPWISMNRGGGWNRGGGGGRGGMPVGRLCKNIKNHGFCRNMDKCPFVHPK